MNQDPKNAPDNSPEHDLVAAARREAEEFLDQTVSADGGQAAYTHGGLAEESIPGYRIIREIHRGGQGVVYQAIQRSTKRKVAIKVMREGPFGSPSDRARFDREVQVLGQLKHPNIVPLHDSGEAAGHFYFVMDYISGLPLDVYLAGGRRSIEDTLQLFSKICEAVNAAHLRGIIHRDLKPGNISIDAQGEPHVLDFGLAKMAGSRLNAGLMTLTGQFIGSLPWASPEQAEGNPDQIDVRTDVYSLGVLLYQMLTGKFPYEVIGNLRDVLDRIIRVEPVKPSTIRRQINDEVETIILKCLSKERDRRYQSAGELARDLRHYLAGEPIYAKRDSAWYVLRKTMRRYRAAVVVAASLVLLLSTASVVSTVLWRRAVAAEQQQARERQRADDKATEAERHQRETQQVADFLASQLRDIDVVLMGTRLRENLLSEIRKSIGRSKLDADETAARLAGLEESLAGTNWTNIAMEVLDANIFERSQVAIETQFQDQLPVAAQLLQTVAATTSLLGLYERSEATQSRALSIRRSVLGEEHPDTLRSMRSMGSALLHQAKLAEAEVIEREALEKSRLVLGEDHPDTLKAVLILGEVLYRQGRLSEAEPYLRQAMEKSPRIQGDNDPDTLASISLIGSLRCAQGGLIEAEAYQREALEKLGRVLGTEHPRGLAVMSELLITLRRQGKLVEAESYCREALEAARRLFGDEHPYTLSFINHMGSLLSRQGKLTEAELYYREGLESSRRVLGDEHASTLASINNLGSLLESQGRLTEAEPYFREALEKLQILRDDHPDTLVSMVNLADLLVAQDRLVEGESYYREAMAKARRVLGEEHLGTVDIIEHLGALLHQQDRHSEAELYLREALEKSRRILSVDRWEPANTAMRLGIVLREQSRFRESEELLLTAEPVLRTSDGVPADRHSSCLDAIVKLYESWHASDPTAGYDARAAEWRAKLNERQATTSARASNADASPPGTSTRPADPGP